MVHKEDVKKGFAIEFIVSSLILLLAQYLITHNFNVQSWSVFGLYVGMRLIWVYSSFNVFIKKYKFKK